MQKGTMVTSVPFIIIVTFSIITFFCNVLRDATWYTARRCQLIKKPRSNEREGEVNKRKKHRKK